LVIPDSIYCIVIYGSQVTHLLGVLEEVQASSARVNQAGRA
jgi:hypothetical protein